MQWRPLRRLKRSKRRDKDSLLRTGITDACVLGAGLCNDINNIYYPLPMCVVTISQAEGWPQVARGSRKERSGKRYPLTARSRR